jgi:hypothetical protein
LPPESYTPKNLPEKILTSKGALERKRNEIPATSERLIHVSLAVVRTAPASRHHDADAGGTNTEELHGDTPDLTT